MFKVTQHLPGRLGLGLRTIPLSGLFPSAQHSPARVPGLRRCGFPPTLPSSAGEVLLLHLPFHLNYIMFKPGGHVRGSFCLSSLDLALLELPHGRARELPAAENPLCAECFKNCKNVSHLLKTYSGSSTVLGASKRRRRNTRPFLIADCVPSSCPSLSWSQSSLPTMARIDKGTQNFPQNNQFPLSFSSSNHQSSSNVPPPSASSPVGFVGWSR